MTGFNSKRDAAADKQKEYDPCPQCIKGAVCRTPKCGRLALPLDHPFRNAQPAQEPKDIAKLVEGMEVSVDVSTGEHDSGNRLFGTVTLAQENQSSKHGLILLVQEPEPNFSPAPLPMQKPVASVHVKDGLLVGSHRDESKPLPDGQYGLWPIHTTPPQRKWVGLTIDEMKEVADRYHLKPPNIPVAFRAIESKLKEKNNG